jgi:hypothetical protein
MAAECASRMAESGHCPDFSLAALADVDRLIDEHSQEGAANPGGFLDPADLSQFPPEQRTATRLLYLGCFVGEVLRQEFGGDWQCEGDDPIDGLSLAFSNGNIVRPVGKVFKRFHNGEEDSVAGFGAMVKLLWAPVPSANGDHDGPDPQDFIEEGLYKLLATEDDFAWLQLRRRDSDDPLAFYVNLIDGRLVIQTFHMSIEKFPDLSATLGVLHKHDATATIEEMTAEDGAKAYWTCYRIDTDRDVQKAAAGLRELIPQEFPNADLSDFVAEVIEG